jgi:DNA-binding transcriptional MerR regulator
MERQVFIPIFQLCESYQVERAFFEELQEIGLIQTTILDDGPYLHQDSLVRIEKIIRIHRDLNVNLEGVDVVLNLLEKVDQLKQEMARVQARLRIYENEG